MMMKRLSQATRRITSRRFAQKGAAPLDSFGRDITCVSSIFLRRTTFRPIPRGVTAAHFASSSSSSPPISPAVTAAEAERFLTDKEKILLGEERRVLNRILTALEAAGPHPAESIVAGDIKLLKAELDRLDDLFLLVVVGEFNSGKSSLINALLGKRFLPEGPVPTTSEICVVRYGDRDIPNPIIQSDGTYSRTVSVPWMKYVNIVDTPGTNAIDRHHERLTRDYVPLADLLLFVTSADRPFSESERSFLESIKEWGKKALIIVNKTDLLNEQQLQEVKSYVRDRARSVLGTMPQIYDLSTRAALNAKLAASAEPSTPLSESEAWKESNMAELEQIIISTLDSDERLRLKLDSPASTAGRICARQQEVLDYQLDILKGDLKMLELLDSRMKLFRNDMYSDFHAYSSRIEVVLAEALSRAETFLDDKLNYSNMYNMVMARDKLVKEFEDEVGDIEVEVSRQVDELAGWIVKKCQRQWEEAMNIFEQRMVSRKAQLSRKQLTFHTEDTAEYGRDGRLSGFDVTRNDVLRQLFEAVRLTRDHDMAAAGEAMTRDIKSAVLMGGAIEVGAAGVFGALLSASLLDMTAIVSTSVAVIFGFGVLPFRRAVAKRQLRSRMEKLKRDLNQVLQTRFEEQLLQHADAVKDAVLPFSRFVRVTNTTVELQLMALKEASKDIEKLRREISKIGSSDKLSTL